MRLMCLCIVRVNDHSCFWQAELTDQAPVVVPPMHKHKSTASRALSNDEAEPGWLLCRASL